MCDRSARKPVEGTPRQLERCVLISGQGYRRKRPGKAVLQLQ